MRVSSTTTSRSRRFVHLRYAGTDTALPVSLSEPGIMRRDFEALHRQRFGFVSPEKAIFAAAIEVEALGGGDGSPRRSLHLSPVGRGRARMRA